MKLIDILQEVKITRSPKIGTGRPLPRFITVTTESYGMVDLIEPYTGSIKDFESLCEEYSEDTQRSFIEYWDLDSGDVYDYMEEFGIGEIYYNYSGACLIPTGEETKLYILDVKEFPGGDIRLLLGDYTTYSPELKRRFDTFIDNLTNSFD